MNELLQSIDKATVSIPGLEGQGVLLHNQLLLTAAHCINFSTIGAMALGEEVLTEIETSESRFKLEPIFIEPTCDIAVLSAADYERCPEDDELFEGFCQKTKPIQIEPANFKTGRRFSVKIRTHNKGWVPGMASQNGFNPHLIWVEAEEQIQGGTSGGPIVNEDGLLVGIVSNYTEATNRIKSAGSHASPYFALPTWIHDRINGDFNKLTGADD